ncbi:hypothetical protein GCM10010260_24830 [Streptomyces filipinensis]|uniref:Uncharacterized protein n=1 Tax=Streptomyces filipinensis TaxID=66887 RepID=A0A918MA32_9ACTN|nr:hypothetical protein [Streptomyces filipinensis]GGU89628.1 hypothetical protein GCM10010260_24830 [Streptomyces filipinensis]
MLRFMDWSVVAMGCVLVLGGLGGRRWQRTRVRKNERPEQGRPFIWTWQPLLMGLGMICARVPGLLRAPHLVVEVFDALSFGLAVTVLGFYLRSAYHCLRSLRTT